METIESEQNETLGQSDELVGNSLFYDSIPDDSLFTVQEIPDPEQFQQNDNEGTMELNDSDGVYQEAFNSAQDFIRKCEAFDSVKAFFIFF